jgi:hypothetical protein
MAMLLSVIMKADSEPTVAVFLALKNSRTQRDVLMAAAEMELTPEKIKLFGSFGHECLQIIGGATRRYSPWYI